MRTDPPCPPPPTLVLVGEVVGAAGVRRLCARVASLVPVTAGGLVVCDARLLPADLRTVAALTRAQLTARRLGGAIAVSAAGTGLPALIGLLGLAEALPCAGPYAGPCTGPYAGPYPGPWTVGSVVEPGRQAESGEQRRVEEVVDVGDAAR